MRLIPAQFVKPYRKSNKNDFIDAETIAEAVTKQKMRFVQISIKYDSRAFGQWVHRLAQRAPATKVVVEFANKLARIGCAVLSSGKDYRHQPLQPQSFPRPSIAGVYSLRVIGRSRQYRKKFSVSFLLNISLASRKQTM